MRRIFYKMGQTKNVHTTKDNFYNGYVELINTDIISKQWRSIALVVIFLLGIFLYGGFFVEHSLSDPDEGRYAEIAREMLETGDFITPHLNYVKYLEKPPLFYWLTAGSMAVFGQTERRPVPYLQ